MKLATKRYVTRWTSNHTSLQVQCDQKTITEPAAEISKYDFCTLEGKVMRERERNRQERAQQNSKQSIPMNDLYSNDQVKKAIE